MADSNGELKKLTPALEDYIPGRCIQKQLDNFFKIHLELIQAFGLGVATLQSRNLSPVTTFLRFMHNGNDAHITPLLKLYSSLFNSVHPCPSVVSINHGR